MTDLHSLTGEKQVNGTKTAPTDTSQTPPRNTAFARLTPCAARTALIVAALSLVGGVAITLSPLGSGFADVSRDRPGDVQLYRAEVDRIATGEAYYGGRCQ